MTETMIGANVLCSRYKVYFHKKVNFRCTRATSMQFLQWIFCI